MSARGNRNRENELIGEFPKHGMREEHRQNKLQTQIAIFDEAMQTVARKSQGITAQREGGYSDFQSEESPSESRSRGSNFCRHGGGNN